MKVCQIMALDEELASLEDLQILHGADGPHEVQSCLISSRKNE